MREETGTLSPGVSGKGEAAPRARWNESAVTRNKRGGDLKLLVEVQRARGKERGRGRWRERERERERKGVGNEFASRR